MEKREKWHIVATQSLLMNKKVALTKKLGVGQMLKIFKRFPQGVYC